MDREQLENLITSEVLEAISDLHVFSEIDSTNAEAGRLIRSGEKGIQLIVADSQSAGKGRRGRNWVSPAASGLYLSLAYPFVLEADSLQGLSLVAALTVLSVIEDLGAGNLQLKWPNDILVDNRKLSGILLELHNDNDQTWVVFGIGVNYNLSDEQKAKIDRPVTDIREIVPGSPSLELLAAAITDRLIANIAIFIESGFSSFHATWNRYDRYQDRDIVIQNVGKRIIGRSQGVDESGALLLLTEEGVKKISGGEIFPSLRAADEFVKQ